MSSLNDAEKRYIECLLGMESGYVLNFSRNSFHEFFKRHQVDILGGRYQAKGDSMGKRMRSFWELESDQKVGSVLSEMLESYRADCELNNKDINHHVLEKCSTIVDRLLGRRTSIVSENTEDSFLDAEFTIPNIGKLPIDAPAIPVIEARLGEARRAMKASASLSVIFLSGSVLEAVLLGAAQKSPSKFNQASASPRTQDGHVKKFHEWSLAQFIDVSCELGLLKPDVKKFSHGLRDFRNYIHPYQQMASGFMPDQHTAKLCFQVLKAALADVAGER